MKLFGENMNQISLIIYYFKANIKPTFNLKIRKFFN